ncbi:unnamed protein product [Lactuca virosa]|uniref:Uncharacterized protein n=1 Tax=Lactuca virosa TaxID=75947 RepID=A0AAU9NFU9_9ASTR|nr:unnamed protein product [Lactuca virosa]
MFLLSPKLEKFQRHGALVSFSASQKTTTRRTTLKLRTLNGGDGPLLRALGSEWQHFSSCTIPENPRLRLGVARPPDFRLNFTMNKGGAGGGTSGAGGPTAAAAAAAAQNRNLCSRELIMILEVLLTISALLLMLQGSMILLSETHKKLS